MDIWAWVRDAENTAKESGNHRLAEIIDTLPTHVVDDEFARVDAIVPEGLHLARQSSNKWLEIFFRHWNLQSKIMDREEVKGMLPEAISLVDFCHQEDTRDCPQSICVIQDLAQCYESIDDKGYAKDRLAVAEETLQRITPDWPCFDCIGSEYTGALVDMDKPQEALAWIASARKEAHAMQAEDHDKLFQFTELAALIELERLEEALACAQKAENPYGGEGFVRDKNNSLSLILCKMQRYDEALEHRLDFDEIKEACSYFAKWSQATYLLVKAKKVENNWNVDSQLDYMAEKLASQGVIRRAIRVSQIQAKLALRRNRPLTVQRCIKRIETLIPELNLDKGASEELQQLVNDYSKLEEQPSQWSFESVDSVLESLDDDIELNQVKLTQGMDVFPDAEPLVLELERTLRSMHRIPEATSLLASFFLKHPESSQCLLHLGLLLLNQSEYKQLDSLLGEHAPSSENADYLLNWHWVQANVADKKQDNIAVKKHLEACLSVSPMSYNCLRWLASLNCELGDYQASIDLWDTLIDKFEDETQTHWDRLIPATLSKRWDLVCGSANALNFSYAAELVPEEPVYIELERIRLEIENSSGDKRTYYARRTGPVTARIIDISSPHDNEQLFSNEYVFFPSPMNALDQTDDDGQACDSEGFYTHLFPVVKLTKQAGYASFYIDGFYPDEKLWKDFEDKITALDGAIDMRSNEEYELEFEGERSSAIYVFVAMPAASDKQAFLNLLKEQFGGLNRPLVWPHLFELSGNKQEAERHKEIEKFYHM